MPHIPHYMQVNMVNGRYFEIKNPFFDAGNKKGRKTLPFLKSLNN
tara:strand:+ start:119 stop:253 length:135 start_codon:yes stop_codon:yes gene_type:complete